MTSVTVTSRRTIDDATQSARTAIVAHHAALTDALRQRVTTLYAAVAGGSGFEDALRDVVTFLTEEVLPHAEAEEQVLYRAAHEGPARLLVAGMVLEHEALTARIEALPDVQGPVATVAAAEAIGLLFEVHVAKENDLLLPALAEEPHIDLPALLTSMHAVLGELGAATDADLDVRTLPHRGRHDVIFAKLEAVAPGARLVIVNDHDPIPLHHQIDAVWPGQFAWDYLQAGPELWRVAIARKS